MMLRTYEATLRGNNLEWTDDAPQHTQAVRVHVTVLEQTAGDEAQGRHMAEALDHLAQINAFSDIADPVAWQREQRKDRSLPTREA